MCPAQEQNTVMPLRLEPAASQSRVKHSTTETLCSLKGTVIKNYLTYFSTKTYIVGAQKNRLI